MLFVGRTIRQAALYVNEIMGGKQKEIRTDCRAGPVNTHDGECGYRIAAYLPFVQESSGFPEKVFHLVPRFVVAF
jgi:hypothetical protein